MADAHCMARLLPQKSEDPGGPRLAAKNHTASKDLRMYVYQGEIAQEDRKAFEKDCPNGGSALVSN